MNITSAGRHFSSGWSRYLDKVHIDSRNIPPWCLRVSEHVYWFESSRHSSTLDESFYDGVRWFLPRSPHRFLCCLDGVLLVWSEAVVLGVQGVLGGLDVDGWWCEASHGWLGGHGWLWWGQDTVAAKWNSNRDDRVLLDGVGWEEENHAVGCGSKLLDWRCCRDGNGTGSSNSGLLLWDCDRWWHTLLLLLCLSWLKSWHVRFLVGIVDGTATIG